VNLAQPGAPTNLAQSGAPMTPPPLVALDGIRVQFPAGRRTLTAVEGVSLYIGPGETLALVGESGSGKSTIGNVVAGLQRPTAGAMRFRGQLLDKATWRSARRAIQIIFQDPFGALDPRMPVSAIIAEPLLIQRIGNDRARTARAADLVDQVGLPRDALNRYPHEFSGGQRQRIAIARALAPDPALIVADEPLSALDVSIQSQILNLLGELQRAHGLAYLFISHDLAVVNHLADRVAVLYLGRLVEVASRGELFATPSHPYTTALLEAMPRIGHRHRRAVAIHGEMPSPLDPPPGCVFHTRCPKAQAICRTVRPLLEAAPGRPTQLAACHFKA
jgi:oligopeptide/dipeptide ABC transporter ATP-binding protein